MLIYYYDDRQKPRYTDNVVHASFMQSETEPPDVHKEPAEVIDLGYVRARKLIRDLEAEYLRHYPYLH